MVRNTSRKKQRFILRKWVQLGFLILTVGIGIQFFSYVHHMEKGMVHVIERPAGVEGFLPIGALMGFKQFFLSGHWDKIHPAAMVILGFAILISLIFKKSFCGWVCPVGCVSEWITPLGASLFGKNFAMPGLPDVLLRIIKYTLLGFFIYVIGKMGLNEIQVFLESPYYKMADVKMLHFFTRISKTTLFVLWLLFFFSLIFKNFWCRYLCPYGALMSVFSFFSPFRINRKKDTCIQCKKCDEICPYHLKISEKKNVISTECSACMDCVKICPVEKTLTFEMAGTLRKKMTPEKLAVSIILIFLTIVFSAKITGHWKSRLTPEEFKIHLRQIDAPSMRHP